MEAKSIRQKETCHSPYSTLKGNNYISRMPQQEVTNKTVGV